VSSKKGGAVPPGAYEEGAIEGRKTFRRGHSHATTAGPHPTGLGEIGQVVYGTLRRPKRALFPESQAKKELATDTLDDEKMAHLLAQGRQQRQGPRCQVV